MGKKNFILRYEKLWSFGFYENEKVGLERECEGDPKKALEDLKKEVYKLHDQSLNIDDLVKKGKSYENLQAQYDALEKRHNELLEKLHQVKLLEAEG